MPLPLHFLSADSRRRFLWLLWPAVLVLLVVFAWSGAPLNTPAAPLGILSLQLAANLDQAEKIILSWDEKARLLAAFGLGLDYLFMLVYAAAFSLSCRWAAEALRTRRWPLAKAGVWLAWGVWLAALLDAVENVALLAVLLGTAAALWPRLASTCALVKLGLLFAGLVYLFYAMIVRILTKDHER